MEHVLLEIAKAIKDRNEIEKDKLDYDKSRCSTNDELNERAVKTQEDMTNVIKTFAESVQNMNKSIEIINNNQNVLYQKLVEIENRLNETE